MMADRIHEVTILGDDGEQGLRELHVTPHDLDLLAGQGAWLAQHTVRYADLAYVVQQAGQAQRVERIARESQLGAQRAGVGRDLLGVLTRVPIAVIHHRHQGFEDAKAVAVRALIRPVIRAPIAGDGDARALGFIHALVGPRQQGVSRAYVLGKRRHADGELHRKMDALGRDQGRDGGQVGNALGHGARRLEVGIGQEHGEFVAPQPRRGVRGAAAGLQHLADAAQGLVPGLVAVRVVEELEVGQVDQQQAHLAATGASVLQRGLEAIVEGAMVIQVGDGIALGLNARALVEPRMLQRHGRAAGIDGQQQPLVLAYDVLLAPLHAEAADSSAAHRQREPGLRDGQRREGRLRRVGGQRR